MDGGARIGPHLQFVHPTPEQQTRLVERMIDGLRPCLADFVAQQVQLIAGRCDDARYVLRYKYRAWALTLAGDQSAFGDEKGARFVNHLFKVRPGELIHAMDLSARVLGRPLLQERNLREDQRSTVRRIEARARECKAVIDDPTATERAKEEALNELEGLAAAREVVMRERAGGASKCTEAIRKAIHRFHDGIAATSDPVLQGFAQHIKQYLLEPSRRFSTHPQGRQRAGVAGYFVYERPPGVVWED
jgi:hypothetical protein